MRINYTIQKGKLQIKTDLGRIGTAETQVFIIERLGRKALSFVKNECLKNLLFNRPLRFETFGKTDYIARPETS